VPSVGVSGDDGRQPCRFRWSATSGPTPCGDRGNALRQAFGVAQRPSVPAGSASPTVVDGQGVVRPPVRNLLDGAPDPVKPSPPLAC